MESRRCIEHPDGVGRAGRLFRVGNGDYFRGVELSMACSIQRQKKKSQSPYGFAWLTGPRKDGNSTYSLRALGWVGRLPPGRPLPAFGETKAGREIHLCATRLKAASGSAVAWQLQVCAINIYRTSFRDENPGLESETSESPSRFRSRLVEPNGTAVRIELPLPLARRWMGIHSRLTLDVSLAAR